METYTCKTGMFSAGKDIQEKVGAVLIFLFGTEDKIFKQCFPFIDSVQISVKQSSHPIPIMSENESAKAYLERRKAVVGRLQGQHQVPGSTSKTLAQVKDICIHLFKYKP